MSRPLVWLFSIGVVLWVCGAPAAIVGLLWLGSDPLFLAGWLTSAVGLGIAVLSLGFALVRAQPRRLLKPTAWAESFRRAGVSWRALVIVAATLIVSMPFLMAGAFLA